MYQSVVCDVPVIAVGGSWNRDDVTLSSGTSVTAPN